MSDFSHPAKYIQQIIHGDLVENGKAAIELVEILVRNKFGDEELQEQQPFVPRDGGQVWIVGGSKNKDRLVEGHGRMVIMVNKAHAKIESLMGDYVMFPIANPPSAK
jgi:hypothetical protein